MGARSTFRTFGRLAALGVVATLAAGCIRSDLTVKVNDDGSGTYTAIVALNPKAFAELSKQFGGDTGDLGDDPCRQIRDDAKANQGDLPAGAKVENYSDGDYCGVKITAPFAAGDNPSAAIEEVLGGAGADTAGIGLDTFSIKKSGTGWTFEAKPQNSGDTTGGLGGANSAVAESFLKGAYSIVRINLPGRVIEKDSNPDAIDGSGTLIWNLNLTGETRTLKARTEAGAPITSKVYTDAGKSAAVQNATGGGSGGGDSGSSAVPLIIGGVVVVAAIVGFVLWRRSKRAAAGAATAGTAGAVMGAGFPVAGVSGAPAVPPMAAPSAPSAEPSMSSTAPVATMPPAMPTAPDPTAAGAAAPTSGAAVTPGEPQWDAARNAYILWDAGSAKWLQYDNAAGAWKPIE